MMNEKHFDLCIGRHENNEILLYYTNVLLTGNDIENIIKEFMKPYENAVAIKTPFIISKISNGYFIGLLSGNSKYYLTLGPTYVYL